MGKPTQNWMDGAGILGKAGNSAGTDEYFEGKVDSDESGSDVGLSDGPAHLKSDPTLEGYLKTIQSDYADDYDKSWGPYFHGEDNYPAQITKTKGGKKVVGD